MLFTLAEAESLVAYLGTRRWVTGAGLIPLTTPPPPLDAWQQYGCIPWSETISAYLDGGFVPPVVQRRRKASP